MSEYNNPRPLPNASASDPCTIYDDAVSFNKVVNGTSTVTTYTGKQILSLSQAIDLFGFGVAPFTFTTGGTLESKNLLVSNDPADGFLYKYVGSGSIPLTVTAGTNPTVGSDWQPFTATDHNSLSNRNAAGAHDASAVTTDGGGSVQDFIDTNTFKTVSDMKSFTNHIVGSKVVWQGYYSQSDGGGNLGVVKYGPHVEDMGSIFSIDTNVYIEANLKGESINAKKFGLVMDGITDDILNIRRFYAYIKSLAGQDKRPKMSFPYGMCAISDTWTIDDDLFLNIKFNNTEFVSIATTPKEAMILTQDLVLSAFEGKVTFNNTTDISRAKFNTGLSVQSTIQGSNKCAFYNVTCLYFKEGLVVGDAANDLQCSEHTFYNYNQFECTTAFKGGGSQSGASFIGGNLHGVNHVNLPDSPIHAINVEGGFWSFNGSSVLTTQSASYQCIKMAPDKGSTPTYPQVRINGGVLETASPLLLIENPLSATATGGQFSIIGTGGYCGAEAVINANFIQASADFAGVIQVKNNNFYAAVQRNAFNISVGSNAKVETDSTSWGANFRDMFGGCNGGRMLHESILGAGAFNAAPVTYLAGQLVTLKFGSKYSADKYTRYNEAYNLSTGLFTCPAGGISALKVDCGILSGSLVGSLLIRVDGVEVAYGIISSGVGNVTAIIEGLSAGQVVGVYIQPNANATLINGKFNYVSFTIENT